VPTSNLERCEDPSSRGREVFGTTSRSQTKLEKAYSPSENNLEFNRARFTGCSAASRNSRSKENYSVQFWGTAANSNVEIIQRFQNKYLGIIVNAPWYVINDTLHHDLNVPYIRDEIKKLSQRCADRLEELPNTLAIDLMSDAETPRRLKRKLPQDLCI